MPSPTRALVAEAAAEAERLVATVRILVALSLGAIFATSVVGTGPPGDAILLRQHLLAALTMLGYLAVGLFAWRRARRGRIGRGLAFVLATLDVSFIVASVALGLANTALPPDFAFGLPVLWLAPLVLAFGTLRYDAGLQLYVMALLLLGIVAAALASGPLLGGSAVPPPPQLALFFALPPNIMRLLMLLLAGLVLAVATRRTRLLLERAIAETRQRLNLTRYLPPQIADMLAAGDLDALRRGRRQPVAVLFVDIRGFTARAETMPPEDLGRFLTAFRERVALATHRHGGVIDKFMGDGAMLVFGVPEPAADDAARSLACAEALLTLIGTWSAELVDGGAAPVRIGIGGHFGEVFVGAVGDEQRLEHTVLGDVVNTAQRLQELTREAGCALMVSAELIAAAGAQPEGAWSALPERILRGRRQPVRPFVRHPLTEP
jgi:adenylate cyclase